MRRIQRYGLAAGAALVAAVTGSVVWASSHREAPFISKNPKVDATDFYLFRSYETNRKDFITVIANYQGLQDAYGGPNYFTMDKDALYEINLDNNGDAKEDLTFRFKFTNTLADLKVPAGDKMTSVPLINIGPVSLNDQSALNVKESYSVTLTRGDRRRGISMDVTRASDNAKVFPKPTDNVGTKSFPNYAAYAKAHIYDVKIPGCNTNGRMFVGQRKDGFAVNLGTIFDLINAPPAVIVGGGTREGRNVVPSTIDDKNVTSIALELPISCVKGTGDVVGGWTTAWVKQVRIVNPQAVYDVPSYEGGPWTQVSRLSAPLVNEVFIGLKDKDRFNGSEPKNDAQFAAYVTNPSLPELIEVLFGFAGVQAPNVFPRTDLVAAFLTGVTGVNANGSTAEMLRLNMAIDPTAKGSQNSLGAAGCFVNGVLTVANNPACDAAGFPNGRRPGDDTVDIALRVAMGYLLPPAMAPSGQLPITDGALCEDSQFDKEFPYLLAPLPGAQ